MAGKNANSVPPSVGLMRSLSLPLITFYGLGNILGAGIYVLIGKVVGYAGLLAPLSFLLASLLAMLTAFTYAELSARFPLSAGEAVYVHKGLNAPRLAMIVGILIVFAGTVSSATILRGFVGYLQVFAPISANLAIPLLVVMLGGLAAWGISQSVRVAATFTLIEMAGLLIVIGVGTPGLVDVPRAWAEAPSPLAPGVAEGIAVGAFLAFYAFIGFEDMVNVAEEVRDPERNLPRAILWAIALSTLLYFAVSLVAVVNVPTAQLGASEAPLALIYQQATGREPVAITVIGMLAVINGALIQIIMASRVVYGMANKGWLPAVLSKVNARTHTPILATALVALMVLLFALWGSIETLAKVTSFLLLMVFGLANLALWRLKYRRQQPAGIIDVPIWVPAIGFLSSVTVILVQALIDLLA